MNAPLLSPAQHLAMDALVTSHRTAQPAHLTRMGVSADPSRSSSPLVKAAALVCTRPSSAGGVVWLQVSGVAAS